MYKASIHNLKGLNNALCSINSTFARITTVLKLTIEAMTLTISKEEIEDGFFLDCHNQTVCIACNTNLHTGKAIY